MKRVDKNGTAITATYTPTVTPVTPTAESVTSIGNKVKRKQVSQASLKAIAVYQ